MIRTFGVCWLFFVLAALGYALQEKPKREDALRQELLDMVKEDQDARMKMLKTPSPDEAARRSITDIDRKNTARLKEIVDKHGWPGKSLVGDDGAHAAWLLVQHADKDRAFQKRCLTLLKQAVKAKEAAPTDLAYLTDRVLVGEKKKQIYGTQFQTVDGKMEPYPIEDEKNVDRRRKEVGLSSLAEYRKTIEEMYKPREKKNDANRDIFEGWTHVKRHPLVLEKPRKHPKTRERVLRGKQPSQATRRGTDQTWPSVMMCW